MTDKDTDAAGDPYAHSHTAEPDAPWSKPDSLKPSRTRTTSSFASKSSPNPNPTRGRAKHADDDRPELKPDSVGWQRALSYLKNKGSVVDVKRKYSISPENEKALLKAAGVDAQN